MKAQKVMKHKSRRRSTFRRILDGNGGSLCQLCTSESDLFESGQKFNSGAERLEKNAHQWEIKIVWWASTACSIQGMGVHKSGPSLMDKAVKGSEP